VRLGQLLATQLACAQEEMDRRRWPPETKETAPSSAPVLAEEKEATSLDQATTLDQATMMPVQEPLTVEPALEESLEQSFSIDDLSEVGRGSK
jgi:hypothetical protein